MTTKRISWLAAVCVLLVCATARGVEFASCNAVSAPGACAQVTTSGQVTQYGEVITSGHKDVWVTVQADENGANASEVVLLVKYCASCQPVQFPPVGDPPITNIGSVAGKPSRTFYIPEPYSVRGSLPSWGGGNPVSVLVRYE